MTCERAATENVAPRTENAATNAQGQQGATREGEIALARDPAAMAGDAHLVFIGRVDSPWKARDDCPKNLTAARAAGATAIIEIDAPYRAGLTGLEGASHLLLLTWLDRSTRTLIVQKPRHSPEAKGVFALRSPVRPNPIGLHVVKLLSLDIPRGLLGIDAIDVLDGTPVIDLKPYLPGIDAFPDAVPPPARGKS